MRHSGWNRNLHYHDLILQSIPPGCRRALDVGCGRGVLTRQLGSYCEEVVGIDRNLDALAHARTSGDTSSAMFVEGDVMTHPFDSESFDLITAVAVLHHLPLQAALLRCSRLLKPGGLLAVIGLHHTTLIETCAQAAVALPVSWAYRCVRGHAEVGAPIVEPVERIGEIRSVAAEALPGAFLTRLLLFRYSLFWRKPAL